MSAAPSFGGSVPATLPHHLRCRCLHAPPPLGSTLAWPPPPATAPRTTAPAHNTQHHQRIAGLCKHPLTAPAAADARSVPPRYSDVSCVIIKRLGASDAAPAASMKLPARTAAPRLAPRKPHHPLRTAPYSPVRNRRSPQTHHINPCTAGGCKHPPAAQALPMHAAYR